MRMSKLEELAKRVQYSSRQFPSEIGKKKKKTCASDDNEKQITLG